MTNWWCDTIDGKCDDDDDINNDDDDINNDDDVTFEYIELFGTVNTKLLRYVSKLHELRWNY